MSVGLLSFQRNLTLFLWLLSCEDPIKLYMSRINYHQTVLKSNNSSCRQKDESSGFAQIQNDALAKCYEDLAEVYKQRMNHSKALQAIRQALFVKKMNFGEEHKSTADSYYSLGITQHDIHDYNKGF